MGKKRRRKKRRSVLTDGRTTEMNMFQNTTAISPREGEGEMKSCIGSDVWLTMIGGNAELIGVGKSLILWFPRPSMT